MTETYNKCQVETCTSTKDLLWHDDGGEMIRLCRSCHNKVMALKRRGISKEDAMKVLNSMQDVALSTTTTANTKLVSARIPLSLLSRKKKGEKDTEFVIRAIESIDKAGGQEDPFLRSLAKKMVKLFADKNMKMRLDDEEIELVKRLYSE